MRMKWLEDEQCWVFDDGRVATPSKHGLHYRKISLDNKGYARCRLYQKPSVLVHRLIAKAFIKNPDNKPTVDHIDRNPLNNSIDNLRFATYKEQADNRNCVDNCVEKYGIRACEDKILYDRLHGAAYYKEHKEKIRIRHKKYREEHINEYRAYQAKWHRERRKAMKEKVNG